MPDRAGVTATVIELILQVKPGRELPDLTAGDTRLDSEGLDLDSVEIVEIVVGCEERYGRSAADLIEGSPVTFGEVVDYFATA